MRLWEYSAASAEPVAPRPLHGDWRDEYAIIYDAASQRGIDPEVCDRLEIWVLASALGANRADEDDDPLSDETGLTWNQRRAVALVNGDPEPQWEDVAPTARELADMRKLMGGIEPMVPPGFDPPA